MGVTRSLVRIRRVMYASVTRIANILIGTTAKKDAKNLFERIYYIFEWDCVLVTVSERRERQSARLNAS